MENLSSIGIKMYSIAERLFPICRSITGEGVRQTLRILQDYLPLDMHEVPSGANVFDWTIPKEWNIRDAWIKGPDGQKIIDFKTNNLHLLNYSIPIHQEMALEELQKHLFSLPNQPDLIPYRTSYYQENWGFCLTHRQFETLPAGNYEVYIDSTLEEGSLTYGEFFIPGKSSDEILLTAHVCHPSLANDNLSGISLLTALAQWLQAQQNRYSYRFLFIPGTIGSITWLALNEARVGNIKHGLVSSLVGDAGGFTYKRSRRGDAEIDQVAAHVLKHSGYDFQVIDFFPYGYDERQFCSPGFNLPVGNLTRSPFGQYPEYHTSGDNLQLIQPKFLAESFDVYQQIISVLEQNDYYLNLNPKCEPQLGKRGLYEAVGGQSDQKNLQLAMLWVLNFSDGKNTLLDIANRAELPFNLIFKISKVLIDHELLRLVA
jgi:aminopeptidase-like protein